LISGVTSDDPKLFKYTFLCSIAIVIANCSSDGGGGDTSIAASNKFTASDSSLSVDEIVSLPGSSALSTSIDYYGRFVSLSGSNVYVGTVHFTVNRQDATTAYFSDFFLDYYGQATSYNSSTTIQGSSVDIGTPVGYNASTNSVTVGNTSRRVMNFSIDFTDNTNVSDVTNAAMVFSNDFTTMVGGGSDFFFIAQKASAHTTAAVADLQGSWGIVNFSSSSGSITLDSYSSVSVSGSGGNALAAFTGASESGGGAFGGKYDLVDSSAGVFAFGFDSDFVSGTPTADGTVDGIFLQSPDKQFLFGVNIYEGLLFAASR